MVGALLATGFEVAACVAGVGFLVTLLTADRPPSPELVLLLVWTVSILAT